MWKMQIHVETWFESKNRLLKQGFKQVSMIFHVPLVLIFIFSLSSSILFWNLLSRPFFFESLKQEHLVYLVTSSCLVCLVVGRLGLRGQLSQTCGEAFGSSEFLRYALNTVWKTMFEQQWLTNNDFNMVSFWISETCTNMYFIRYAVFDKKSSILQSKHVFINLITTCWEP